MVEASRSARARAQDRITAASIEEDVAVGLGTGGGREPRSRDRAIREDPQGLLRRRPRRDGRIPLSARPAAVRTRATGFPARPALLRRHAAGGGGGRQTGGARAETPLPVGEGRLR